MKLAKYISKDFLQIDAETDLVVALKKLRDNRAFDCIVNLKDRYFGVLSLIKILGKRLSRDTKVKDLAIKVKTLTSSSDEDDAMNAIVDEISIVPLLDRGKVSSVVQYSSLLRLLYSQKVFDNIYVENVIDKDSPSFYLSERLEEAVEVAKSIKHFTYPVVDVHGKLFAAVKIYELIDYLLLRPKDMTISNVTTNDYTYFSESSSLKVIVEKLMNNLDDMIIVNSEHVPIGTLNVFKLFKRAVSPKIEGNITISFSGEKDASFSMYLYSEVKRKEHFLKTVGKIKELRVNIKKIHGEKYEIDFKAVREDGNTMNIKGEGFRKDTIVNDLLDKLESLIEREKA
ncbi:MAG: hypothetical protein QXP36_11130 [Conexivisphaerales archaeon]